MITGEVDLKTPSERLRKAHGLYFVKCYDILQSHLAPQQDTTTTVMQHAGALEPAQPGRSSYAGMSKATGTAIMSLGKAQEAD
jgi:hypothetical protein